jgi:hypothetical protein
LPALELLVDHLAALKVAEVSREVVELLAGLGVLVGDGNLEGGERIEDIELCVFLLTSDRFSLCSGSTYWSGSRPCSS